jgi:hypothetical protein
MAAFTFDDFKSIDDNDIIKDGKTKPAGNLAELDSNGAKVEAATVLLENFDGMDYETIYNRMSDVAEDIAPGYGDTLRDVAQQIITGISDLKDQLETLESDGGWKGATHDAAMANLLKSYDIPEELRKGALALGVLSEYFSQTMATNKHNIVGPWPAYQWCLESFPSDTDDVKKYFNDFAHDVMKNLYSPEITDIASHQPAVSSTETPDMDPEGDPDGNDANNNGWNDSEWDNSGWNNNGWNNNGGGNNGGGNGNNWGGNNGGGGNGNNWGGNNGDNGGGSNTSNGGGGNNGNGNGQNGSPPPFSPPNLSANTPGGDPPSGGGNGGSNDTPKQSFNPPDMPNVKSPDTSSEPGDPSGAQSVERAGAPGIPATMPNLDANTPTPPDMGELADPSQQGAQFDPSKLFNDPKSVDAANKLLSDPKKADAAKKLLSDPKLADAAKTLFGDGAKGLLGDPKALEAAKTLFGDPEAADAAKTLFGDPDTAKAAQQLLNDPQLDDVGKALRDSAAIQPTGVPGLDATDAIDGNDSARSLLSPTALSHGDRIPGVAASLAGSPSGGDSSLLSGVFDGVNQIVQTATQGATAQHAGFGGPPGFDPASGIPGEPADHPGGGAGGGHGGGAGGGAAGPGKLHLATAGAPVAAANLNPLTHSGAVHPGIDPGQAGSSGGGSPAGGGGHGGGGKGGDGSNYKGNKALRGSHNGQDLIGQPDAVVSVIGDDSDHGGSGWSVDT